MHQQGLDLEEIFFLKVLEQLDGKGIEYSELNRQEDKNVERSEMMDAILVKFQTQQGWFLWCI